jgi:hypothetical protein
MSVSPERRFATSPKHEMLKKVFKKPQLSVSTSPKQVSLAEYKRRQTTQRVFNMEDQLDDMTTELNRTRERVDSISRKLDLLIHHLCKNTQFEMDDI